MPCNSNFRLALCAGLMGLFFWGTEDASAQSRSQPTPFTIRFDDSSLLEERSQTALPLWLQGVSVRHYRADIEQMQITVVRFDLRRMKSLAPFIELRVGLSAGGGRALATAWSETGQEIFRSNPFGSATKTTTETLRVATEGADYVELELPRNGERLQSLFAAAMRYTQVLQAIDFSPEPVFDAFGNPSTTRPASEQDRLLWNRVQALLDAGPFELHPDQTEKLEFEISTPPECAILTFEARNTQAEFPPVLRLNETDLPNASFSLPDLADPAWRAKSARSTQEATLLYTGWIRVQQFIPGGQFLKGTNQLEFLYPDAQESLEIRKVEIQLRFRR